MYFLIRHLGPQDRRITGCGEVLPLQPSGIGLVLAAIYLSSDSDWGPATFDYFADSFEPSLQSAPAALSSQARDAAHLHGILHRLWIKVPLFPLHHLAGPTRTSEAPTAGSIMHASVMLKNGHLWPGVTFFLPGRVPTRPTNSAPGSSVLASSSASIWSAGFG